MYEEYLEYMGKRLDIQQLGYYGEHTMSTLDVLEVTAGNGELFLEGFIANTPQSTAFRVNKCLSFAVIGDIPDKDLAFYFSML